ncbi:acyl-CoA dehydrogenase family protein [Methylobacterium soli]|uniref:DNA alkylation response protein n=1 Tax=Methylobacterium soli TaxID=553447 RepID=A0A6L3SUQ2_9HYPH|nr:acyl-CoA dehydrogenase family protein [Methylobacterium soli]KAB1077385.1 DNA alkylation response protein [Methylobacterium soli]GJE43703.1 Putative acyl-CoA dehydrogenase AidB [Methylobacterium soli]
MDPDIDAVVNQSPFFGDRNLVADDAPLRGAAAANGVEPAALLAFGAEWGAAERLALGRLANENPPKLRTHDAWGRRADVVEFHPAYHALMGASVAAGLHASVWDGADPARPVPRGHAARAARLYVVAGVESGHLCPMTMTNAALAALAAAPDHLAAWLRRLTARAYEPAFRPWFEKPGVTLGMGMTEKQGGTDVRANRTRAEPAGGDTYALTGHKWFFSAPMSDAFLVLAQAPGGLGCFLVPRHRPDGHVNALRLQRLKDKLGNRANASAEVEFAGAFGWRIGPEGRGIATILGMVQLTRLDCAVASAGLARMALALALHHARHRSVFGRRLVDQPLMHRVLADLALESEAWTALALRLAGSFDRGEGPRARLLTPAVKAAICKGAPGFVYEAMECLGGNGYVEESPLPRLYREAPVNAIWEGSGNVMALDVLRAATRAPEETGAVLDSLGREARGLPGVAEAVAGIAADLRAPDAEARARRAAGRIATLAAAAALAESAPPAIAEAYAATRLAAPREMFGANAVDGVAALLLERALP